MITILKKYINGSCTPSEFHQVSDLIKNSDNEDIISGWMKEVWEQIMTDQDLPQVYGSSMIFEKIRNIILVKERATYRGRMKIYRLSLRIAAVLIIGLMLSSVLLYHRTSPSSLTNKMQTITIPFAARTNFTLSDGSKVWLSGGSTIAFPGRFNKKRTVSLFGEAYFEVAKDKKPFIVSTSFGEVEAKGTSFNVKAFEAENFETTLTEGIVEITEKKTGKKVVLKPGQQVIVSDSTITTKEVETNLFTSWKDGKLILKKDYLPVMAKKLERWYNVKIVLDEDKRLSNIWYTGTIEMESFSEVLGLLKLTAPIDYTFDSKMRTIRITYKHN